MTENANGSAGGRAVFSYPAFRKYELARFLIVVSIEMQSVAVAWQVYDITRQAFALGLTGLVHFLPGVLLFLVAGHAADVIHRRRLLTACYAGFALCSAMLLGLSIHGAPRVVFIYVVMTGVGVVRSFSGPVTRAILPQLVPMEIFPSAVAWHSSVYQ